MVIILLMWQNILHSFLEYIPFSSSTIMLLLGIHVSTAELAFLHLPCGIAVIIYWIPYLLEVLKNYKLILFYIIATIIPVIVGLYISTFDNFVLFTTLSTLKYRLLTGIIGSIILFFSTYYTDQKQETSLILGIFVGLSQSLAIIFPGMSRTGITLSCLLFSGFSYYSSMMHAIILGIPLNIGAAIISTLKDPVLYQSIFLLNNLKTMSIVLITAFLSIYLSMYISRYMRSMAILRFLIYVPLFFIYF